MNTVKNGALTILFMGLFMITANAQQCTGANAGFPILTDTCNQIYLARVDVNRGNEATHKKLDQLNTNLETLIGLLRNSNSNTSSTANSASTTNTKLDDTMTLIRQQNEQASEILHNLIIERFKSLPAEMLTNPLFRAELEKLRNDILQEVDKRIKKP